MTIQLVKGLSNLRQLVDLTKAELVEGQVITGKKKKRKSNETDTVKILRSLTHKYLLQK